MTTTLLGVIVTPILIQRLLRCVIIVDGMSVLNSVVTLVLLPVLCGLSFGRYFPTVVKQIRPFSPMIGIASTLILVSGGSSNIPAAFASEGIFDTLSIIASSCLLPILGGAMALILSYIINIPTVRLLQPRRYKRKETIVPLLDEPSRKAIVIETLSKSPTLAYVLSQKHFGQSAGTIPAAGMVSLAFIGAAIATVWSTIIPNASNSE